MLRTPTTGRKFAIGFSIAGAMMLAGASVVWACTPVPSVTFRGSQGSGSTSSEGPAGSKQTVEGADWVKDRDVDIRWNSAAGTKLVTPSPQGPTFTVDIKIPNVEPGVYTIYFVQPDDPETDGYNTAAPSPVARVSFEVTPEASTSGGGSTGGGNTSGRTSSDTSGAEGGSSGTGGTTAASTSGGSGSNNSAPDAGGTQSFGAPAAHDAAPSATTPARETPTAARPGATTASGGQAVFAGSVGSDASAPAPATGVAEEAPSASALRVVSGDLYSGFDASGDASLLPDVADSPLGSTNPVDALALAAGLFGAALVALFGGFATAELRRRRVTQMAS